MLWQLGIDKFCFLIPGRYETGQMQFGRGTAFDKMAVHLNAYTQGQNEAGTLGGKLRPGQSRQSTKAMCM